MTARFFISVIIFLSFANAGIIKDFGINYGLGQSFEMGYGYNHKTYSKISFSYNGNIEFMDYKYFSFKASIGYSQKGSDSILCHFSKLNINLPLYYYDSTVNETRKSDNLSFSILFKPKYPLRHFEPYFLFGPRLDYLIKREIEDSWLGAKTSDVTKISTKFIFGISAGIGTNFLIHNVFISPFAMADFDINKSKAEFNENFRSFKYAIYLEIGYLFTKSNY